MSCITDSRPGDIPTDFAGVIDAFGGPQAFAAAIGVAGSHARAMKARNSIPPDHWPAVIEAAAATSTLSAVTFELLGRLRQAQRRGTGT